MNDDKDKKAPPDEEEERTVFMPSPGGAEGDARAAGDNGPPNDHPTSLSDPEPAPIAEADTPAEEPRTVFVPPPGGKEASAAAEPPPAPAAPEAAEPPGASATAGAATAAIVPREAARSIRVGDVLNHIFEVKRFIGRGGMGEVFEGCNVNTEERVAIKVMLPAMAADEKIVALFRKEARILTKLQHEALVSYRVLAQEPQLGVLYIVTEFIEGVDLSEMLGRVERTPEELAGLLRRLASGLAHAHRLGAVHRDLSPDNVLLPGGDVHEATIIDFGIAKDLDAGSATIVGDGFAGKLNYVAPEQLGDYGREVGPWTDVYSLGLVMLSVAQGKPVDMSGSLVDAIDKRRKGPDLSAVPRNLRPVLEDMLRPDPKERIRSMDEVLARLGGAAPTVPPTTEPPPASATPTTTETVVRRRSSAKPALVGGILAAALLVAAAVWYALGGFDRDITGGNEIVPTNQIVSSGDPAADARNAINSVLPSVGCTWLDISGIERSGDGLRIAMRGVAGDAGEAQRDVLRALSNAGIANARLDLGDVAPIRTPGCAALDTYRQMRATSAGHVSVPQPRFEMMMQPPGMPYANEQAANVVVHLDVADLGPDFTILGIEPSGAIATLIADRAMFETRRDQSRDGRPIADEGNGRYRLGIDVNHVGWSGIILISGQGPFEPDLAAPPFGSRGPDWQRRFVAAATERNWQVEMVWFESVDRVPGDRAPPVSATPTAAEQPVPDEPPVPPAQAEGAKPE